MPHTSSFITVSILPEEADRRLDAVLGRLLPGWGLRARRRACREGLVLLNGRPVNPALKVRPGQELRLDAALLNAPEPPSSMVDTEPTIVHRSDDLMLLAKPSCLHTAALAGSTAPSLEHWIATHRHLTGDSVPRLLNRLDYGTSGLVAAALSAAGQGLWKMAEDARHVDKRYLALVEGVVDEPRCIRYELDTADRRLTRCLDVESADALRHTLMAPLGRVTLQEAKRLLESVQTPLGRDPQIRGPQVEACTLVGCRIRKGARHQIRVHLASAGFPLCGDPLYGPCPESGPDHGGFVLHHGALTLSDLPVEGLRGVLEPGWLPLLPEALQNAARHWLFEADADAITALA